MKKIRFLASVLVIVFVLFSLIGCNDYSDHNNNIEDNRNLRNAVNDAIELLLIQNQVEKKIYSARTGLFLIKNLKTASTELEVLKEDWEQNIKPKIMAVDNLMDNLTATEKTNKQLIKDMKEIKEKYDEIEKNLYDFNKDLKVLIRDLR